jgi:hypothetical protein
VRRTSLLMALLSSSVLAGEGPWFTEVAGEVGLDFVHFNGMSGEHYYPEVVGPGCALLDYDNDGDLDVYLVQGAMLGEGKTPADALFPPAPGRHLGDRLYRNDLEVHADGTRSLRFTDVTATARITKGGYGIGVAAGDYDNDGFTDLYVTAFGSNRLLRNSGNGTFNDVTRGAGVDDRRLSVSAAFVDFDRDGWLDLYVVNHVDFALASHRTCTGEGGRSDYCATSTYRPVPGSLFRNRGNGTFEDVSGRSGINRAFGAGLGVVVADFDGDAWPDLYVANDGTPNQLWMNRRDGTFREEAFLAGAAVNMDGAAEASMGVDAADFDGDGDEDLFMTHDVKETNTLYINDGSGWFEDRSLATGVGNPSFAYTAFGTAWMDYDNDGWLDLFIANGAVRRVAGRPAGGPYPLDERNQLFRNLGGGNLVEVTDGAGPAFDLSEVGRGAAFGDIDNDGDADVLVANNSGPVRLYRNDVGSRKHWLGLRLLDPSGRDALGARVAVTLADGRTLWRRARADGSYASANDPRVLVGLGDAQGVQRVAVHWPDGSVQTFGGLAMDRYHTLSQRP